MGKRDNGASDGAKIGDNSNLHQDEKLKLSGIISEAERLNEIIADYSAQRTEVFKAAKEQGFDTRAIKHIIKLRAMESGDRTDFESALEAYQLAMGDFVTTDLGRAMAPRQDHA